MATKIDKIKSKVEKLLAKANDVAGTPEASIFEERAFELMAKYGFEQRDLSSTDDNEVICKEYNLTGSYTDMQAALFNQIAKTLHCCAIMTAKRNSSKIMSIKVYGKRTHLNRVDILFPLLNNSMGAQARNQKATSAYGTSTTKLRKSFMYGFIVGITQRLSAMESNAASDAGTEANNSYALVLLDDAKAARAAMEAENEWQRSNRGRGASYDAGAASAGQDAATRADIGQTRVNGMRALA